MSVDRSCRWPRPVIRTDPGVNGGRPCISGVPVSAIAGRAAAGEPLAEIAADHGLTRREALTACWHAAAHGDGYGDDYAGWAQEWVDAAWTVLGTAGDDDTLCEAVPDPPPLADQPAYRPMTTVTVTGGLL